MWVAYTRETSNAILSSYCHIFGKKKRKKYHVKHFRFIFIFIITAVRENYKVIYATTITMQKLYIFRDTLKCICNYVVCNKFE